MHGTYRKHQENGVCIMENVIQSIYLPLARQKIRYERADRGTRLTWNTWVRFTVSGVEGRPKSHLLRDIVIPVSLLLLRLKSVC